MDITTQAEIILRDAEFDTWSLSGYVHQVICFENASIAGFLHVFSDEMTLVQSWEEQQKAVLSQFSSALKAGGAKSWNIYSVFLANGSAAGAFRVHAEVEENFSQTRKLARSGISTQEDLIQALLPLLMVRSSRSVSDVNFQARLRQHLLLIRDEAVNALFSQAEPSEVARMLEAE